MATILKAGNATTGLSLTPDNTGILELKTGTGSGTTAVSIDTSQNFKFNSGYGSVATVYGCRAWVKFVGATGVITASGNVSGVVRDSTGKYTVTFATAMPDATYAYNATGRSVTGASGTQPWAFVIGTPTTTAIQLNFQNMGAGGATYTNIDPTDACVTIFR